MGRHAYAVQLWAALEHAADFCRVQLVSRRFHTWAHLGRAMRTFTSAAVRAEKRTLRTVLRIWGRTALAHRTVFLHRATIVEVTAQWRSLQSLKLLAIAWRAVLSACGRPGAASNRSHPIPFVCVFTQRTRVRRFHSHHYCHNRSGACYDPTGIRLGVSIWGRARALRGGQAMARCLGDAGASHATLAARPRVQLDA